MVIDQCNGTEGHVCRCMQWFRHSPPFIAVMCSLEFYLGSLVLPEHAARELLLTCLQATSRDKHNTQLLCNLCCLASRLVLCHFGLQGLFFAALASTGCWCYAAKLWEHQSMQESVQCWHLQLSRFPWCCAARFPRCSAHIQHFGRCAQLSAAKQCIVTVGNSAMLPSGSQYCVMSVPCVHRVHARSMLSYV